MTTFGLLKYSFLLVSAVSASAVGARYLANQKIGIASKIVLSIVGAGFLVLVDSHYVEPNWIQVERVAVRDSRLAGLIGSTKIVHITDIHLNAGIGYREKQLIKKVNALHPDLIFFTGDIVDDLTQLEPAKTLFGSLEAKIGMFGVPGNTDHIVMDGESLKREMASAGIDFLVNESRRIRLGNGKFLWIVGIDDPKYRHARMERSFFGVREDAPAIILVHEPSIFDALSERGRQSLVLAGDTHGGQVGIPLLIRLSDYANRTPYMQGLFKKGATQMYVNRGIGMKTLPVRFLCRPEIAVIEVVP